MICPNCGSNNPDGTTFCANCGSSMNAAPNNGAVPPQAPQQFPGGSPIEQRNIALCIILSIVTCGIYGLYWIYKLTEDVNKLKGDPNATSGGIVILLGIVTCGIYMWYWLYKQGDNLDQIKASRGLPSSSSGLLYLILAIVGLSIVSYALMQNELNQLA